MKATDAMQREKYLADVGARYSEFPPTSALPYFCSQSFRNRFIELAPLLSMHIEALAQDHFTRKAYPEITLPAHLNEVISVDLGCEMHHPVMRADCFLDEISGDVKILELNCADPSALAWTDWLQECWLSQFGRTVAGWELQFDQMMPRHAAMVRNLYRRWCAKRGIAARQQPRVALSISRNSTVHFDFEVMEKYYRQLGWDAGITDPKDFEVRNDKVFYRGAEGPVDIIVRDTLDEVISPDDGTRCGAFIEVCQRGLACIVNPCTSHFGDEKSTLPLLRKCDPRLREVIPKTVSSAEWQEGWERGEWVLKPSSGYGGFDVTVGRDVSPDQWREAIRNAARQGNYVLQEYVATQEAVTLDQSSLSPVFCNVSFWIVEGQYCGAFARYSPSRVINFHQGGGLVPVAFFK